MEEFEIIRRARAMLTASPTGAISEQTRIGYKGKGARLFKAIMVGTPEDALDRLIARAKMTRSSGTWFSRRAALSFSLRLQVEALLTKQDQIQRALRAAGIADHLPDWDDWRAIVSGIEKMLEWHTRLQNEVAPPMCVRAPRHSKRKDIKGLPGDWRERMVKRLPKYREAVLTQAVSGCRPEELVKGVRLSIEGDYLVAEIQGAKVTKNCGQPWRRLHWSVESGSVLIQQLAELVKDGVTSVQIQDAKRYSSAVRAASEREWPSRPKAVTPYCFRHQAASDMKCSGMDDGSISMALGHCSDEARSYYGHWRQGKKSGGVAPALVTAARVVKTKNIKKSCDAGAWKRNNRR